MFGPRRACILRQARCPTVTVITPASIRAIATGGLAQATAPQHVIVVGAGMAGLTAADQLLTGRPPGNDPRGPAARWWARPYPPRTVHGRFARRSRRDADPRNHDLTLHYVERFKLPTAPFTMNNPRAWVRFHGRQVRAEEFRTPEHAVESELDPREAGSPVGDSWSATLAPILGKIRTQGDAGWAEVAADLDQYTLREFLEARGWSHGAIELFGLFFQMESLMNTSFLELLREEAGKCYTNIVYIEGGMDRLPRSFLPALGHHIRFGSKLTALSQMAKG